METLDFTKYAGSYSLSEAKEVASKMKEDILKAEKKEAIKCAQKIHGDGFNYEVVKNPVRDLRKLKSNQRVCASNLNGYHILLTEKNN